MRDSMKYKVVLFSSVVLYFTYTKQDKKLVYSFFLNFLFFNFFFFIILSSYLISSCLQIQHSFQVLFEACFFLFEFTLLYFELFAVFLSSKTEVFMISFTSFKSVKKRLIFS